MNLQRFFAKYFAVMGTAVLWFVFYFNSLRKTDSDGFYFHAIFLLTAVAFVSTFFLRYSIYAREQIQFYTAFAIGLGGKFLVALLFLVYQLYWANGLTTTQVIYFFAMYFSFTAAILYSIAKK